MRNKSSPVQRLRAGWARWAPQEHKHRPPSSPPELQPPSPASAPSKLIRRLPGPLPCWRDTCLNALRDLQVLHKTSCFPRRRRRQPQEISVPVLKPAHVLFPPEARGVTASSTRSKVGFARPRSVLVYLQCDDRQNA